MKIFSREELEELLRTSEPDFKDVAPSTDVLAMRLEKMAPYLKIRLVPIGSYVSNDVRGNAEGERWGSTIDTLDTDYNWCGSLWETLAISYLRIIKAI